MTTQEESLHFDQDILVAGVWGFISGERVGKF